MAKVKIRSDLCECCLERLDLRSCPSGWVIERVAQLLFQLDLLVNVLSLSLSNVIRHEWEIVILEVTTPERNHLCKAAWCVSSRENCRLSGPL